MRILHIIGTLDPESGGPAASVIAFNEFRTHGTVHEAVTLDNPSAQFLSNLDLRVTALGPVRIKYGLNRRLVPWLKANATRFDGVVVHGLWQYCGLAAWRAFAGTKPYMVFLHGMLDPYFKRAYPLKHLKKWPYWILFEYWVLRGAYRVLLTCAEEERLARQSFRLQNWTGHIVSLGTGIPAGDNESLRHAFLSRFPRLRDRRFLLFLGRIDRKKGCDLLIDAFLRAASLDPDLDLVMAGPDEKDWRKQLEAHPTAAALSHRVHWTGMLGGEVKWGAFLCSEVFILPSHQENFGIAVTEAMACSKPVLLSDKVNIAREIAAAGAGIMESDTADGIFVLISAWIATPPEERKAIALRARLLFETRYDMRINARELGALLQKMAEQDLADLPTTASVVKETSP